MGYTPANNSDVSALTETISSKESTWDGKYAKPTTGVPKADLASTVQASLDKADSALQEHQDISGKVDKITGKGLSTNDYTTNDKNKLASMVSVKDYGAVGDGVADDTDAFTAALSSAKRILIPSGTYIVKSSLSIGQGKELSGEGASSKLILKTPSSGTITDFIKLSSDTFLHNMSIEISSNGFQGSAVKVNNETLDGCVFSGTSNVNIRIDGLSIYWKDYTYTQCSNFEISISAKFNTNYVGFYGVNISNCSVFGCSCNVGYFLKSYCSISGGWITGCVVRDCIATGTRWGIFNHTSDEDFSDAYENTAVTNGINQIMVTRYQHQCDSATKGFCYLRKNTAAEFTDCVPWDWGLANGSFANHPFCFSANRYATSNNQNIVEISPKPRIDRFLFINSDGTSFPSNYNKTGKISSILGSQYVIYDAIPKQIGLVGTKSALIFKSDNSRILASAGSYFFLHFKYIFQNTTAAITIKLDGSTPYILTDRNYDSSKTKFGYKQIDGTFYLYIYFPSIAATYSYLESTPISNDVNAYTGSASGDYHNTLNVFNMPKEDIFSSTIPDGIVELSDVRIQYRTSAEQNAIDNALSGRIGNIEESASSWNAKYSKPASGIPSADLSSEVQTSIGKANSALQAHQDISGKVDKVSGKGLSTNDYDAAAKTKVDAIPANPKYTDTVYDDSALSLRVGTVEGKESGWNAKYSKPSTGIPKTDLASAVQTSLGKADSALQNHQDISGKENTSSKVTAITASSTNAQYPSAKAVYDYVNTVLGVIENGSY